jgi:hypothetical protein
MRRQADVAGGEIRQHKPVIYQGINPATGNAPPRKPVIYQAFAGLSHLPYGGHGS